MNNLRFADDITLTSETMREPSRMIREIQEMEKKAALTINFEKFKIVTASLNPPTMNLKKKKGNRNSFRND